MLKTKNLWILVLIVGLTGKSVLCEAGELHGGIRAGFTLVDYTSAPGRMSAGPGIGFLGEYNFNDWLGIQSGFLFSFASDSDKSSGPVVTTTVRWWHIPVLAKIRLLQEIGEPSLLLGLDFAIKSSATTAVSPLNTPVDISTLYANTDIAITAGIGVKFILGLVLDARYILGLSNISTIPGVETKQRTIQVLLGYNFF